MRDGIFESSSEGMVTIAFVSVISGSTFVIVADSGSSISKIFQVRDARLQCLTHNFLIVRRVQAHTALKAPFDAAVSLDQRYILEVQNVDMSSELGVLVMSKVETSHRLHDEGRMCLSCGYLVVCTVIS